MGEEEDGMHHFDVNMPYNSPSTPVDFSPCSNSFEMPPYIPYPPPSNLDDLRQEVPLTSTVPTVVEFEQNLGSISRMTTESFLDADEMVFDINEDLEGTVVVQDDEVRVEAPRSGMEFDSVKDLTTYYKQYAKQEGFGVRTQRTRKDDEGRPVYVTVGCARSGKYHPKNNNISKPRPTTRTDCKARVNATLSKNDKWVFTTVENVHNHITVSPKKTRLLRSHKCLDEYSQRILDLNDRAGIRMNKNFYSLVIDAGGF